MTEDPAENRAERETESGPPARPGRGFLAGGLTAVILGVLALVVPAAASACSCARPQDDRQLERYYESADGALTGRMVDVRRGPTKQTRRFVYRMQTAWKGEGLADGERGVVVSSRSDELCGVQRGDFRTGLLLSRDAKGRWTGSLCSMLSPRDIRRAARLAGDGERRGSAALCGVGA